MSQQSKYKNIQLDEKQHWIIICKSIFEVADIFIKQGHYENWCLTLKSNKKEETKQMLKWTEQYLSDYGLEN